MKKYTAVIIIAVFSLSALYAEADKSWELYSEGLELMLEENKEGALEIFNELIDTYPGTEAAVKATRLLDELEKEVDHSGIIPFYLGNMLTTTYSLSSIPMILDIDNGIVLGTTGIAGVGTGLYSAWLMSRERDLTLGHDIWIEFIQAASLTNFQLTYNIFSDNIKDDEIRSKIDIGGMALTALGSRSLTYFSVIDTSPSAGRAFTVTNSYFWAQYYTWMTLNLIIKSENEDLNSALAILLPDAAAVGTYYLWETLEWSFQRAGLVSISGVGGSLFGIFINMILEETSGAFLSDEFKASLVMGFAAAGKGLGVYFTRNMENDVADKRLRTADLLIQPSINSKGIGFSGFIQF